MQEAKTPRIATICLAIALTNGCRTHDTSAPQSLRDVNLTGMWMADTKIDHYKKSTGEYLYSSYQHYSYVITDTQDGTRMSECQWHSADDPFVVKTDDHLYPNVNDIGYSLVNGTTLTRSGTSDWDLEDDVVQMWSETLTRYQKSTVPHEGNVLLSQPVIREYSKNVCAFESWDDLSDYIGHSLTITQGVERTRFSLTVKKGIGTGRYAYNPDTSWNAPIRSFWLRIQERDEYILDDSDGNGSIVLETLDSEKLTTSFNLTGESIRIEGAAEFTPPWELKR